MADSSLFGRADSALVAEWIGVICTESISQKLEWSTAALEIILGFTDRRNLRDGRKKQTG